MIAQSAGELWPKDMQNRAPIAQNTTLRIRVPLSVRIMRQKMRSGKAIRTKVGGQKQTTEKSVRQPLWRDIAVAVYDVLSLT